MKHVLFCVVPLVFGLAVAAGGAGRAAAPAEDAQALLATVDGGLTDPEDQVFEYDLVTEDPGRATRTLTVRVAVKGRWRRTEFLAPGDMKGTRVLTLSPSQIYVWLPAYQKVRRVASHASRQNSMGTTFSEAEQALSRYADHYDATIDAEDETTWTLELAARDLEEVAYPRLRLVVDKAMRRSLRIDYFLDRRGPIKTEVRGDYECRGNACTPGRFVMDDHRQPGLRTTITTKSWKTDVSLPEELFTVRALQRSPAL